MFLLQAAAEVLQEIFQPQGQSHLCEATWGYGHQVANHNCLQGLKGKACTHQQMGAGLQIGEVEAVVPGIPGLVLGELHLNSSAVFWLCCSAGAAGFSLLDAQKSA